MRTAWTLGACLVLLAAPALADTYQGELRCAAVAGGPGALRVPMSATVNGSSVRYDRQVMNENGGNSGRAETGGGTLAGDHVTMTGTSIFTTAQEEARYEGTLRDGRMELTGQQSWTMLRQGTKFTRPCRASLAAK